MEYNHIHKSLHLVDYSSVWSLPSPPLSVCIFWKLSATSSLQRSAPLVSSLRALPLEVDRLQIFELNLELNLMC